MAFSAKIVGYELVLRIPMNAKPEKSASGKTLLVASIYGNEETDCLVDGNFLHCALTSSLIGLFEAHMRAIPIGVLKCSNDAINRLGLGCGNLP